MKHLKHFVLSEEGQSMTEYGIIVAVIAVAVVGLAIVFRKQIVNLFKSATGALSTAEGSAGDAGGGP